MYVYMYVFKYMADTMFRISVYVSYAMHFCDLYYLCMICFYPTDREINKSNKYVPSSICIHTMHHEYSRFV